MSRLKEQYGIKTDADFDESLRKSGMTRADMEARLHDTILMNKVFGRELRQRDELADKELRERYDREKERYRLPERARLREIIVIKPDDPSKVEAARERANDARRAGPHRRFRETGHHRPPTPAPKPKAATSAKSPAASSSPTSTKPSSTPPPARFSARSKRSPAGTS